MAGHVQTLEELESHLQDQLGFLQASADSFDAGLESEAKRIALAIRVLVHDTRRSKSLLGQLGRKSILFVDTALPNRPGNKLSHNGLAMNSLDSFGCAKYMAFLDDKMGGRATEVIFEDWWNGIVIIDDQYRELSRKDLVLAVADQDGGAHVDASLEAVYADLSRNNSLGWEHSDGVTSKPMSGAEKAALRQIGHEVLKTLIPGYTKLQPFSDGGVRVAGLGMLVGEDAVKFSREHLHLPPGYRRDDKVGRNQSCPCGSGNKFKRCCGR